MSSIGFIGTGKIGATLARLAISAGHEVVLSNRRGPDSLTELAAELGPHARAATLTEAARSDLVVLSIPFQALPQIPAEPLRGRTVIDTTNYNPDRGDHFPRIDAGLTTTGEMVQAQLAGARVVKAFSNIFFKHLATLGRPVGAPDRSALPIAGDNAAAKAQATAFIESLGYDVVDAGALSECRRWAFGTPANAAYLDPEGRFAAPGRPATKGDLERLLESVS